MDPKRWTPIAITAGALTAIVLALHSPVFTRGALVTPASMHYAMWPWKAYAARAAESGVVFEENSTLSDVMLQFHPWETYAVRRIAAGESLLWNPHSYCGVPFLANPQTALLFPLHWPVWAIPSVRVFTIAILLKIFLAGIFMAVFLRGLGRSAPACLLGSVSFALCGFMTTWLGYPHTNAAIFLPLLMHAARSMARTPGARPLALLSLGAGAACLGGHPETAIHVLGAAGLYFLACLPASTRPRAAVAAFAAAIAIGVGLAAMQIVPFAEYASGSAAMARRSLHPTDAPLPLGMMMALISPRQFGLPWNFTYQASVPFQELAGYAGAGVLLLALLAFRDGSGARFFQVVAVVTASIIYGPAWLAGALRPIPLLGITSHNRLILLLSFSLAVLAAHALDRLGAPERRGSPRAIVLWIAAVAAGLVALVLLRPPLDPADAWLSATMIAGTAALAGLMAASPRWRGLAAAGIALAACADMTAFAHRFNPHADPRALYPPTAITDFLHRDMQERGPGRFMAVGWTMRPETYMAYDLSSIEGYDAIEFSSYRKLIDRALVDGIHRSGKVPEASRPMLDLVGLRYVLTPPGVPFEGEAFTLAYDGADGRVFVNDRAAPRFSFVERAVRVDASGDGDAALDRIAREGIDPSSAVLLEGAGGEDAPAAAEASSRAAPRVRLVKDRPGDLAVEIGGQDGPGYLVVDESFDRGWRATVNGAPAPVLRANHTFMAVPVPAGAASVALAYAPRSVRTGFALSGLSALFLGFALWFARRMGPARDRGPR